MKFLSLFSGIGGMDYGLELAGMTCAGQVEIDPYCQRVLKHHWPRVKLEGDIRNVKSKTFGPVDLVCGGFPCQPFSCAGKQRGKEDDRYLWPQMLRVIRQYRPAWVLGENVAGIVNMELDTVLADLERENYETRAFIVPACAVDAPHERKRVWIVAYAGRGGCGWAGGIPRSEKNPRTLEKTSGSSVPASEDVADAVNHGPHRPKRNAAEPCRDRPHHGIFERDDRDVADAERAGLEGRGQKEIRKRAQSPRSDTAVAHAPSIGRENLPGIFRGIPEAAAGKEASEIIGGPRRWAVEPGVGRVAHGVPGRVDRLRALGNAVVPQVVEQIGRAIMAADAAFKRVK